MTYLVSITSQGQISIPSYIRRRLGLNKNQKALVKEENERIIIEPIDDLLSLGGVLKHKAIKGKSIDEIIALEEKAWEMAAIERYKRKNKK